MGAELIIDEGECVSEKKEQTQNKFHSYDYKRLEQPSSNFLAYLMQYM